jgi:hypothetical protein
MYCFVKSPLNFDEFIKNALKNKDEKSMLICLEQTEFLKDDSNKIVIPYIKLENINKDWPELCKNIGLPETPILHENKSNNKSWQSYYDENPHIIELVKNYYHNDFVNFNYDVYYPKNKL